MQTKNSNPKKKKRIQPARTSFVLGPIGLRVKEEARLQEMTVGAMIRQLCDEALVARALERAKIAAATARGTK